MDRFYVGSPLCVPSRAGLLTGRIATRCGISNHRGAVGHLRAEEFTIAELVKANDKEARNIQVAVHVGDMTSKNEPKEWKKIRSSYRKIDGVIPYVVCVESKRRIPRLWAYGCQTINDASQVMFDSQEIATAHRSDPRDNGLTFHAMLFNAQWMRTGGDGWLLLLEFQPDNRSVHVR